THIYLEQQVNHLGVASADLNVTVTASGQVVSVGGGFMPGLSSALGTSAIATTSNISPVDAVRIAAKQLGLSSTADPVLLEENDDPAHTTTIEDPEVPLDRIPAHLQYVPTADGRAVLAWDLIVRTPNGENWFDLSVPATSDGQITYGDLVYQNDWVDNDTYN